MIRGWKIHEFVVKFDSIVPLSLKLKYHQQNNNVQLNQFHIYKTNKGSL